DVRQQVAAGAAHVTFGDPDFLNGPRHALAVARALHAEFPALTFDFTAKIEHLLDQRAHLAELAALGALFVVSAAESLDDAVLALLDKGHTRADIQEALAVTRAAGLSLPPTPARTPRSPSPASAGWPRPRREPRHRRPSAWPLIAAGRRGSASRGSAERSRERASWPSPGTRVKYLSER